MSEDKVTYSTSETGSVYKTIVKPSGQIYIMLYKASDDTGDVEAETEQEEKSQPKTRQTYSVGDMNKHGEIKTPDGWVFVGKQGKSHPKVKHLFDGE